MKSHFVTTLLAILALTASVSGQNPVDIYLIGTSVPAYKGSPKRTGLIKVTLPLRDVDKTPAIGFFVRSLEKDYAMMLKHTNLDDRKQLVVRPENLCRIEDWPIDALNNFTLIDIDEFIRTKSREEVWKWMLANDERVVWMIDRSDFYKSNPALSQPDRMKLTATRIETNTIPEEFVKAN